MNIAWTPTFASYNESNFGKPAAAVKTKGEPLKYAQSIIIIEANNHYL